MVDLPQFAMLGLRVGNGDTPNAGKDTSSEAVRTAGEFRIDLWCSVARLKETDTWDLCDAAMPS